MRREQLKQYHINGISYYAHSEEEAFKRYKQQRAVQTGDIIHINKKWYRVLGEKIHEILTKK